MIRKYSSFVIVLVVGILVGCKTLSQNASQAPDTLKEAQHALEVGEFYRAKKLAQGVLQKDPHRPEAQRLMAQILDREIQRYKETFEEKAVEEYTREEKDEQVRTWLERSRMYLTLGHYDQALWSAEQAFLYDSSNLEASRLVDEIRARAVQAGRGEQLVAGQIIQGEIQDRLDRYRRQARQAIRDGKWGETQLAVEKMLLLSPKDPEALRLQEEIQDHRRSESREAGETL